MKTLLTASLVALLAVTAHAAPPTLAVGTPASVKTVLAMHMGKVVVLNFWATWCGPCKAEFPDMVATTKKKGADLITIAIDDRSDSGKAAKFLESNGVTKYAFINKDGSEFDPGYLKWLAPASDGGSVAIPLTFVFSKSGKLVQQAIGAQSEADFIKMIDKAAKAK
jgi:thiol-disulfide isomerase/thioredoxin